MSNHYTEYADKIRTYMTHPTLHFTILKILRRQ